MDVTYIIEKFKGYLLGIWLYRWYGMFAAWLLAILGWTLVASLPDRYQASTRVYIDTQSLIKPLLKDIAITSNPDDRISQVAKTIFNRPNIKKIAQMSDLDLEVNSTAEEEALITNLINEIRLQKQGQSNLYEISYQHDDPNKAKLVIQSILNLFVESTLNFTRGDTNEAQNFLDDQIDYYQEQLVLAEKRLADFKRAHLGSLPQQDLTYYDNLQVVLKQISEQEMKLDIAKRRRDEFEMQIRGEVPTFGLSLNNQVQNLNHPLIQKYNELENQAISLQTRYTKNHPDVINIKREMNEIKASIDQFKSSMLASEHNQTLNENPVYQQMKIALNEAKAEVATAQATLDELNKMAESMRGKVDDVIKTETEFTNLNRDYLINKQKFQALLERRESAKLAEELDDTQQTIKFRIIDPPYVPTQPVGPKRGLFSIAVLMISLMFGVGVAFARSFLTMPLLTRVTSDPNFPYPLLGEIPKLVFHQNGFLRYVNVMVTSTFVIGLISSCAILVFLYHNQMGPKF